MWYLKTKLGTLWIVEAEDEPTEDQKHYVLGMDEDYIGVYDSAEGAVEDVYNHETGDLKWDESNNADAPNDLTAWIEGEPESWRAE